MSLLIAAPQVKMGIWNDPAIKRISVGFDWDGSIKLNVQGQHMMETYYYYPGMGSKISWQRYMGTATPPKWVLEEDVPSVLRLAVMIND